MSEETEFCPLTMRDCRQDCGWWNCDADGCSILAISMRIGDLYQLADEIAEKKRLTD